MPETRTPQVDDQDVQDADGSFKGVFGSTGDDEPAEIEPGQRQIVPDDGDDEPSQPSGGGTLLDRLRQAGYDGDDESILNSVVGTRNLALEMQRRLQAVERQNAQLIEGLRSRDQPVSPATQPQATQEEAAWRRVTPPKISESTLAMYRTSDGGWREDTPQNILEDVARYQSEVRDFYNAFATDPQGFLEGGIKELVRKEMEAVFGVSPDEIPSRYNPEVVSAKQQRDQQWREMIPLFYTPNPMTRQYDEYSQLTPLGVQWQQALVEADRMIRRNTGREPKEGEAYDMAMWRMQPVIEAVRDQPQGNGSGANGHGTAPPQSAPSAADAREQMRQQHMRKQRAAGVPAAGGTGEGGNPGQPRRSAGQQNPMLNMGTEFAQDLRNAGFFSR